MSLRIAIPAGMEDDGAESEDEFEFGAKLDQLVQMQERKANSSSSTLLQSESSAADHPTPESMSAATSAAKTSWPEAPWETIEDEVRNAEEKTLKQPSKEESVNGEVASSNYAAQDFPTAFPATHTLRLSQRKRFEASGEGDSSFVPDALDPSLAVLLRDVGAGPSVLSPIRRARVRLADFLRLDDAKLSQLGISSVSDRQLLLDAMDVFHRRPFKPSSLPPVPHVKLPIGRNAVPPPDLSIREMGALVSNVNCHLNCIEASLQHSHRLLIGYRRIDPDNFAALGYQNEQNVKAICGALEATAEEAQFVRRQAERLRNAFLNPQTLHDDDEGVSQWSGWLSRLASTALLVLPVAVVGVVAFRSHKLT